MELVDFLRARLDEDEAVARAATPGPWSVNDESFAEWISSADGVEVVAGGRWGGEAPAFETTEDALHIARHDPARVLAEVEAKRALLEEHAQGSLPDGVMLDECRICGGMNEVWPCPTLRILARPFRDHPDFDPAWLEG